MSSLDKKAFLEKYFFYFLFFLGIIVFHKAIFLSKLVDIDAPFLQDVYEKMTLSSFLKEGFFRYDVIFIRDFFLYTSAKLTVLLNHQIYGVFNFITWFLCVFLTQKIFLIKKDFNGFLILAILLCHPMLGWIITWPTANKHLLACFFSLGFVYFSFLLEKRRRLAEWGMLLSYFLALNSQPITLLIPFSLLIIFPISTLRKNIPLLSLLLGILVFYAVINAFYYREIYPFFTHADKFIPVRKDTIALNFLGFSRAFSQILIPVSFGTYYSHHSLLNILGFPFFFLLLFIIKSNFDPKDLIWRLFLILCPLAVVYTKPTNVFVSDPYYLFCLVFIIPTLFISFSNKQVLKVVLITIILVLIPKTIWESNINTNENLKTVYTFKREPGCKSSVSAAALAMRKFDLNGFKNASQIALQNKCLLYGPSSTGVVRDIYTFWIYLNPVLSLGEKSLTLGNIKNKSLIQEFLYLNLLSKSGRKEAQIGIEKIKGILERKEDLNYQEKFIKEAIERSL